MPAVPERIAVHAEVLRSDARALAECAERLRRIEADLEAGGAAPQWLRESVRAHLAACAAAATDLTEAATRMRGYAERAARP
ncbi:hypothetical protein [Streptosporangium carneum]|uniref:Uncharacterized protein n=1 Tax=Streptosporangium carneum TaxID=47481 RepID=A0A9W6I5K9_9ACTN|nr:hypothetical protein [Streptosporangium carneum]GLK11374.1 hypothetical protein GCM10017600_47810 [Streptosporangium carneum]